ncbi:MAG: hypothetical protein IJ048_12080 [Clostridia bacterium]|nr:hypothetical protein [Clostridia bacterium]
MATRKKKSLFSGFSWRRLLGITGVKRKIARTTGIPTTRSGRQRKLMRALKNLLGRKVK